LSLLDQQHEAMMAPKCVFGSSGKDIEVSFPCLSLWQLWILWWLLLTQTEICSQSK